MFRIICGCIIVLGFTYIGRLYAEREKSRLAQLDAFCDGLNMLEFNIRYMNFPMAEAFKRVAEGCSQPIKAVFEEASRIMSEEYEVSSGEAFCRGIDKNKNKMTLSYDEMEIVKSFALSLGKGDRKAEIVNIESAKVRLSASCQDAKEEVNKKVKMTKSISTLAGILIVIVLI
ncbi:MAG: hypothetical protein E7415_02700 [Ruminococcaceae bacterium]|nr:hypothetical protein [Oscillospiraceae bacterium]